MKVEWSDGTVTDEKRTDEHRRGAFKPAMYKFVGWYYLGSRAYGRKAVMACAEAIKVYLESTEGQDLEATVIGDFGKCGVCGARFAMGELWQWTDGTIDRDFVHIGHDCVAKYEMVGADWDALADERRRALEAQRTKARRSKEKARIFAAYPGLEAALATDHGTVRNIAGKLEQYGTLTEPQISLVLKIAGEQASRTAQRVSEAHVPAPTGRVTIRGTVVSLKERTDQYGTTLKMTVKVQATGGTWLAWGTVPEIITKAIARGDEVQFDGEVEAGREPHFAFFKRPTRASITKKGVQS